MNPVRDNMSGAQPHTRLKKMQTSNDVIQIHQHRLSSPQTTNYKPQTNLMRWYANHGRHALPWRRTRDPYAIYISEAMLQQTQVERVIPFYDRWLKQFPTWQSLARENGRARPRVGRTRLQPTRALRPRRRADRRLKRDPKNIGWMARPARHGPLCLRRRF